MEALGGGSIGGWEHGVWVGAWDVWVGAWGVGGVGVVGINATPYLAVHASQVIIRTVTVH